jgi:hypothetical protein
MTWSEGVLETIMSSRNTGLYPPKTLQNFQVDVALWKEPITRALTLVNTSPAGITEATAEIVWPADSHFGVCKIFLYKLQKGRPS